jgi:hypothetical protein
MIVKDRNRPGMVDTVEWDPYPGCRIISIDKEGFLDTEATVVDITPDGKLLCDYVGWKDAVIDSGFEWEGPYFVLSPYSMIYLNFST